MSALEAIAQAREEVRKLRELIEQRRAIIAKQQAYLDAPVRRPPIAMRMAA